MSSQKMKNGCMEKKLLKMSCFIWLIGSIENFFAYVHDTFVPYYPKGIADSWAQEDRLGEELLEILDAYMKF